jgi:hypothetical protein
VTTPAAAADAMPDLFATACIVLLLQSAKKPGAASARASGNISRLRFLTELPLQVNRILVRRFHSNHIGATKTLVLRVGFNGAI